MENFFLKNQKNLLYFLFIVFILSVFLGGASSNKLKKNMILEAGEDFPTPSEFIIKDKYKGEFVTDVSSINTSKLGIYTIEISINDKIYSTEIEIKDTIKPTAKIHPVNGWINDYFEPKDFLEDISDATELNIYFKTIPDFSIIGNQDVSIILEDQGMNVLELSTTLTLDEDKIPPVISGVKDQSIFLGKVISYRKGVFVRDNKDSNIDIKIDSSNVNTKKIGTYEVFYSATDSSLNTTSAVSKIIIKEKPKDFIDREYVDNLADQILSKIIKKDMTEKEKLWEIFAWTKWHITYTGHSDKSDWLSAAVQGIKKASGDCFNYYATERALLERAGFETVSVERVETAPTRHYWVLVKYMGKWYHFDTTQTFSEYPYNCFLKTDAQVEEYTKKVSGLRQDYFTYDKSKYPEVATETID